MSDTAAALTSCWVGFAVWSTAVMTLPGSRLCAVTAFSGHPKKLGNWGFWRRNLPRTRCRWAEPGSGILVGRLYHETGDLRKVVRRCVARFECAYTFLAVHEA